MTSAENDLGFSPAPASRLGTGWGLVVLTLALTGASLFGWQGLTSLPEAWGRPEYSHGWLIPVIAACLFSRIHDNHAYAGPAGKHWPGVALGTLSLLLILLGNLTQVPDLSTYGFIGFLAALVLTGFGLRHGIVFWVAVVYLGFMLPLPQFIYLKLSISLQHASSQLGVALIRLFSVPVFLEGNVIDLGVYKLQVAEACSGLRYLFPLASFGFLFAALYRGPIWHKALLFLSAVPITILMNSLRIGIVGLMVDRFGIEQAEGFLHVFEGWVIFTACILLMFGLSVVLQRLSRDRRPLSETLDLELPPVRKQAAELAVMPLVPAQAVLAGLAVLSALVWLAWPERQFERVSRETFATFPSQAGEWTGQTSNLTQDIETVLGADDYYLGEFTHPDETVGVGLFMAFYNNLTGGTGIHSPEVCLPSGGWEVSAWTNHTMSLPETAITVNRAVIQQGLSRQLVYYWFEQNGRRTTSSYMSKFYAMYDTLRFGRSDAGIVRLVTPILPTETEADADVRLQKFLGAALPQVGRFIPE